MKKLSTSKKIAIVTLLLAMFASTLIGVPLNGGDKGWIYVFTTEWELIRSYFSPSFHVYMPLPLLILTGLQCIVHAALLALPFLIGNKRFFAFLAIIPLLYVLLQLATFFYIIVLLIPFIVIWITTMIIWKYKITSA